MGKINTPMLSSNPSEMFRTHERASQESKEAVFNAVSGVTSILSCVFILLVGSACGGLDERSVRSVKQVERISVSEPNALNAVLSPDGQKLAYVTDESSGQSGVWVEEVGSAGATPRLLSSSGIDPVWSPDSSMVSFVSTTPGAKVGDSTAFESFVVRIANASETYRIGPGNVTWSPDSQWLAYHESLSGKLEVIRPDGSGRRVLVLESVGLPPPSPYAAMTWTPDGETIAYSQYRSIGDKSETSIWSVEVATGRTKQLMALEEPHPIVQISWSPDGSQLGLVTVPLADIGAESPSGSSIWVLSADGAQQKEILKGLGVVWGFAWAPGSGNIAFVQEKNSRRDLWLVNVDTGDLKQLTTSGDMQLNVAWREDDRMIVDGLGDSVTLVALEQ